MKSFLLLLLILLVSINPSKAEFETTYDQAVINGIDDFDYPQNYVEVSEEGLPYDLYVHLISMTENLFKFTVLPEAQVNEFFESLKKNSRARMRSPGGACSVRRAYIQNLLKQKHNVVSGKLFVHCPAFNGRLRLRDRSTNHTYSYANFHDTNILAVHTNTGTEFRVLDVQFEDTPVSLHDYLSEIEAHQRIRPLKRKGTSRGLCYWSITTPYKSYKNDSFFR